jgi:hypothetical protein
MKKVCFFEFWNVGPHLETSFELALKHLKAGDEVHYFFGGHDTEFQQGMTPSIHCKLFSGMYPENIGAKLIRNSNFHFHGRIKLPQISWSVPDCNSKEELMSVTYKGAEVGMAALSSVLDKTKTENPDFIAYKSLIIAALLSGARVYEFAKNKLLSIQPDLVYVFNGRQCRYRSVMNAARELGIDVLFHERGHNIYHYSLKPYPFIDMINIEDDIMLAWKAVPDRDSALILAKDWFEARRRGELRGWKSFVDKNAIGKLPALDTSKKIVTFYTTSIDEQISVGDYVKWDRWTDQDHAIQDLLEVCRKIKDIQLVVRLHPNLANKQIADYKSWLERFRDFPDVLVIKPDDLIDTYQLIEASDYVVTCGSTVGIEAVYWGKPSICMGPMKNHRYFGKVRPANKEELYVLLSNDPFEVDPSKALPYGYYFNSYGTKFLFFHPKTIFEGKFLGKNLRKFVPYFFKYNNGKSMVQAGFRRFIYFPSSRFFKRIKTQNRVLS